MMLKFVVCLMFVGVSWAANGEVPDYVHICRRNDPESGRCLRDTVEALKPRLKDGIPELNIPALEPFFIKEIAIIRGQNQNLKAYLRNINVYGISNFEITKLKVNAAKSTFRLGVKLPFLTLEGDYDIDARLLVVPIKGNGRFSANATNCEGQGILRGEIKTLDDGTRRLQINDITFYATIGDYQIKLENLFGGDPTLSDAVHEVLNQNKDEFKAAATPFVQARVSEILGSVLNGFLGVVDYDKIFPSD